MTARCEVPASSPPEHVLDRPAKVLETLEAALRGVVKSRHADLLS